MTNFNNNKDFMVTTISGKTVPRNKCRFIQNEGNKAYYEMNVDCFLMPDGRWHRINNGKIEFDHEESEYVLLDRVYLNYGIVDMDSNGNPKMGYFRANPIKNVVVGSSNCISDEIPINLGYEEQLSTGIFFPQGSVSKTKLTTKGIGERYDFDLSYSSKKQIPEFKEKYDKYYTIKTPVNINKSFASELKDITYGLEIETSNGYVPVRHCYRNGLIPLRDGSLRHDGLEPFEFTTIPLSGEKGLYTIIDAADVLNKYTEIGDKCSLHLHIGGYKQTKEFVVALHRVMRKIQDELYSMFPSNYMYTSQNGWKAKDYCSPIKDIRLLKKNTVDQNFEALFNYYAGGKSQFYGFSEDNHPLDRDNRAKWNVEQRYAVCNIIPFIWGKTATIEWRLHSPTLNYHKMINWLYICNGIMAYVDKNKDSIANFGDIAPSLSSIMNEVYSTELSNILNKYIQWRKDYMVNMDPTGQKEMAEDLLTPPYSVVK